MLPDIKDYLEPGSPLILSGIIGDRAEDVRKAVASHGFTVEREMTENDWVGMLVRI
jgi:ribosomal protein L11 methylase PrmA